MGGWSLEPTPLLKISEFCFYPLNNLFCLLILLSYDIGLKKNKFESEKKKVLLIICNITHA
jgi:hypothetical protein